MMRRLFSIITIMTALYPCVSRAQSAGGGIIPDGLAARHGLVRCWMTQVEMDGARSRLKDLLLYEGIIYAQTDRAMIHAIDAETGATLWAKQIGRPEYPSMTPGAGGGVLAVINGSRLYVVNRLNGQILLETDIDGAQGAGPAVSDRRVYVPTVKGLLFSYRVKQLTESQKELGEQVTNSAEESAAPKTEDQGNIRISKKINVPLTSQSKGQTLLQPLVTRQSETEECVVWSTNQGCMYIGRVDRNTEMQIEVKYRLDTAAPIIAQPTYLPPDPKILGDTGVVLAATGDGYVYAVQDRNGEQLWRYSTGEPLSQPATIIDQRVYAPTSLSGLHCIDMKTGGRIWYAPEIVQFVSASKDRVYGVDKLGLTRVLDASTGAQLDVLPTALMSVKILNTDTDRVYLATAKGLIQCLREIGLEKPIHHGEDRKQPAEETAKSGDEQKAKGKTSEEKPAEDAGSAENKAADEPAPTDAAGDEKKSTSETSNKAEKADAAKDPFAE